MTHEQPLHFHRDGTGLRRREALRLMAASLAAASSGCTRQPRERIHPWVDMPEARADGSPVFYATSLVRDGFALGVLVATHDGRPTKVEGNPRHPSSLGATDAFAQASVLDLWDPDRSQAVAQRLGREQEGPPAIASWTAFETAWRATSQAIDAARGEGLRVLTGPVTSPTLRAQLQALLARRPGARWHQYSPIPATEAARGAHAVLHLDRASCILSLGGDPFSDGPGAVRQAMDWSRRRADAGPCPAFAVEVAPGLFGARADRRVAMSPAAIEALAARLAAGQPADGFEREVLQALQAAGRNALVVPGGALPPAGHNFAHALNRKLGAIGNTIDLVEPLAWARGTGTLAELAQDMREGRVRQLVLLDVNPVYDAPGALGFADALRQVPWSVHAGLHADETALATTWHLPLSHAFEQWSDALAHDGTPCLVQPAIAPLYDTRSPHEVLALLAGDDVRDGHAIVRRQWQRNSGGDFEASWRESLRKGVVDGGGVIPAPSLVTPAQAGAQAGAPSLPDSLTAHFPPDPRVHDGRFANNAWLQELPHPFSTHTWENAALLGPRTAARFGLSTGDRVRITAGSKSIDAPAWIQRSHAEDVVTLPLGYGRRAAGRIGNGLGFDAYALLPAQGSTVAVRLERLGKGPDFAVTQRNLDPQDREPVRTVTAGGRVEPEPEHPSLYPAWTYPGHAWAMAIDLDACIGCNACTIACQAENNIPAVGRDQVAHGRAMHWIRVDTYEAQDEATLFQPLPCMHCENAPCELVCPVGATVHDSEGLNVQVYNRCIGTRFCSNNCPYKVRRFNFLQFTDEQAEAPKGQRNPDVTVRQRGVMEKCNYCLQRVARARQHEQRTGVPLADGDVVTACQAVCPTRAIHFGDLNDKGSDIVRLRESPRHYALLGELDTKPRTTYLARVKREKA